MNTHWDCLNRSQLNAYVRDRESNVVCHTEGTQISPLNPQLQFQIQASSERKVMHTSFRQRNFGFFVLFYYYSWMIRLNDFIMWGESRRQQSFNRIVNDVDTTGLNFLFINSLHTRN